MKYLKCNHFFFQYNHHNNEPKVSITHLIEGKPNLLGFNATAYILGGRIDKHDAYKINAFNQEASDRAAIDRQIPDTRHSW